MSDCTIHHADCLKVCFPPESVDLIMTSPPYAQQRKATYGGIPEDKYVDWFAHRAAWFDQWLKPTGSMVVNIKEHCEGGQRHTYVLDLIYELKGQGWRWVEEYIWRKSASMPGRWPNRLRDGWERCLHFTKGKGKDFKFRPDAVRRAAGASMLKRIDDAKRGKAPEGRVISGTGSGFGVRNANLVDHDGAVYPDNVIELPPVRRNVGHPAAYPVDLPLFFIQLLTDEGDVVLDPFCGSGSTLVAARRANRKSVGIEIQDDYVAIAEERLKAEGEKLL